MLSIDSLPRLLHLVQPNITLERVIRGWHYAFKIQVALRKTWFFYKHTRRLPQQYQPLASATRGKMWVTGE